VPRVFGYHLDSLDCAHLRKLELAGYALSRQLRRKRQAFRLAHGAPELVQALQHRCHAHDVAERLRRVLEARVDAATRLLDRLWLLPGRILARSVPLVEHVRHVLHQQDLAVDGRLIGLSLDATAARGATRLLQHVPGRG
tara:strand:+ start:1671 stop:2090 length:420 start_codon:yes stop_codon:yes gene_type:complete